MTTSHYYRYIHTHTHTHTPYIAISNHNIADCRLLHTMNDFIFEICRHQISECKIVKSRFLQPDLMISTIIFFRSECIVSDRIISFICSVQQNRKNSHYRVANCIKLTRFFCGWLRFYYICFRFHCVHSQFIWFHSISFCVVEKTLAVVSSFLFSLNGK